MRYSRRLSELASYSICFTNQDGWCDISDDVITYNFDIGPFIVRTKICGREGCNQLPMMDIDPCWVFQPEHSNCPFPMFEIITKESED